MDEIRARAPTALVALGAERYARNEALALGAALWRPALRCGAAASAGFGAAASAGFGVVRGAAPWRRLARLLSRAAPTGAERVAPGAAPGAASIAPVSNAR